MICTSSDNVIHSNLYTYITVEQQLLQCRNHTKPWDTLKVIPLLREAPLLPLREALLPDLRGVLYSLPLDQVKIHVIILLDFARYFGYVTKYDTR